MVKVITNTTSDDSSKTIFDDGFYRLLEFEVPHIWCELMTIVYYWWNIGICLQWHTSFFVVGFHHVVLFWMNIAAYSLLLSINSELIHIFKSLQVLVQYFIFFLICQNDLCKESFPYSISTWIIIVVSKAMSESVFSQNRKKEISHIAFCTCIFRNRIVIDGTPFLSFL